MLLPLPFLAVILLGLTTTDSWWQTAKRRRLVLMFGLISLLLGLLSLGIFAQTTIEWFAFPIQTRLRSTTVWDNPEVRSFVFGWFASFMAGVTILLLAYRYALPKPPNQ